MTLGKIPQLPSLIKQTGMNVSNPQRKSFTVRSKTSIEKIITFVLNISETGLLTKALKETIGEELTIKLYQLYPSGESVGETEYIILYCLKVA